MIGVELGIACGEIVQQAIDRGVLVNVTSGNVIRLLPPLILGEDEAKVLIDTVCELVTALSTDHQAA